MSEKNPFDDISIDVSPIERHKTEALNKSQNAFDATIGETSNKSAQAGAIQGVGNASRLSADTYAGVAENRDKNNLQIETQFDMAAAESEVQQKQRKIELQKDWESKQAGFFDTAFGLIVPALGSAVTGLGALGFGEGIWDTFNKKSGQNNRASKGGSY